jgi:hypothetical protein
MVLYIFGSDINYFFVYFFFLIFLEGGGGGSALMKLWTGGKIVGETC